MNPKVHPTIRSIVCGSPTMMTMDQNTCRVDSVALWKATLGFFPGYVNLNKRVSYETQETMNSTSSQAMANTVTMKGMEVSDGDRSTLSVPEMEWSDISESSTGWEDCDTTTDDEYDTGDSSWSCYHEESGSDFIYSSDDASSDESYWSSDLSTRRRNNKKVGVEGSWMEKMSRFIFGAPIP